MDMDKRLTVSCFMLTKKSNTINIKMIYHFKLISGDLEKLIDLDVPSSTTIGRLKARVSADLKIDVSNIGIFTEIIRHLNGIVPDDMKLSDIMPDSIARTSYIILMILSQKLNVTVIVNGHSHTISCNYDDTFLKIKTIVATDLGIDFSKLTFGDITIMGTASDDIHGGAKTKKHKSN